MTECEKFAEKVFAAQGELCGEESARLERHCAICPACRTRLDELHSAARAAEAVPQIDETRWEALWDSVEKRTVESLPARTILASIWRPASLAAAAAAILLAAYVFMPGQAPIVPLEAPAPRGEFELVSLEVLSDDYDVFVLASSDNEIPVIWLERL